MQTSVFGRFLLSRVIKKEAPDAIFFYFIYPTAVFFGSRHFHSQNIFLVPQGVDVQLNKQSGYGFCQNPIIREAVREAMLAAHCVLYMSASMRASIEEITAREYVNLEFVPTATNIEKINSEMSFGVSVNHSAISRSPEQRIILSVGRNHPKKGFDLIPAVATEILAQNTGLDFIWFVIGKDTDKIAIPPSLANVIFPINPIFLAQGELDTPPRELIRFYKSASVFCAPTRVEGLSLTFIDVLASKTPIVATNSDGVRELIVHGETGLLSEPDDVRTMARNILHMLADEKSVSYITDNGFRLAHEYSWDLVIEKYCDLIEGGRSQ
jgi:glycosyltransferase involved in cell wall biosynthesis